jgi:hypothetical protein
MPVLAAQACIGQNKGFKDMRAPRYIVVGSARPQDLVSALNRNSN